MPEFRLKPFLRGIAVCAALFATPVLAQPQVLATVGQYTVTAGDLEEAVNSAPFADRFASLDENQQAALRGDLLQRLVSSRLLTLEATRLGLDKKPEFIRDLAEFRRGQLYQAYWNKVRAGVVLTDAELADLKTRFAGDGDALAAAQAKQLADRYQLKRAMVIEMLKDRYHFHAHEERIDAALAADTVLAEGDGFTVRLADLGKELSPKSDPGSIGDALYARSELLLVEKAALEEKIDVSEAVSHFSAERLPAELLAGKAHEWIPSREAAIQYFQAHPQLGQVPEMRHVGQLVAADRKGAEQLRQRIEKGESLFALAGDLSIDPYGRQHSGDMGWLKEGSGHPNIEKALANLPNDKVSEPIETPLGWSLVMVIDRQPGKQMAFNEIEDRVQQAMYSERIGPYLKELEKRYAVAWNVVQPAR